MFCQILDEFPKINQNSFKKATTISFYLTVFIILFTIITKNKFLIKYYFPISIFICIGGLSMATNEWKDLNKLITCGTLVRYIIPCLLIVWLLHQSQSLPNKENNIINSLLILITFFVIYNIYLLIFYKKNAWEVYGTYELNVALISSVVTKIIILSLF